MTLLKDLAARNATARTARDACVLTMEALAARQDDVTFALAYNLDRAMWEKVDHAIAGVRVLVTDDEPDARDVMRVALESHGAEVVSVASAADAMQALAQSTFDVIVADIGMPGQDGYSLMRSIRQLSPAHGGTIPAVAVTAYATLRERDEALSAGFTAHIGKPFDPERLVATIAQLARGVSP